MYDLASFSGALRLERYIPRYTSSFVLQCPCIHPFIFLLFLRYAFMSTHDLQCLGARGHAYRGARWTTTNHVNEDMLSRRGRGEVYINSRLSSFSVSF
jgi:hypothetical protein